MNTVEFFKSFQLIQILILFSFVSACSTSNNSNDFLSAGDNDSEEASSIDGDEDHDADILEIDTENDQEFEVDSEIEENEIEIEVELEEEEEEGQDGDFDNELEIADDDEDLIDEEADEDLADQDVQESDSENETDGDEIEIEEETELEIPDDSPKEGEIVFNEIMADTQWLQGNQGQWLEILNVSSRELQLDDCVFIADSHQTTIDEDLVIGAGEYLIMGVKRPHDFLYDVIPDWTWKGFKLNKNSGHIELSCYGESIDSLQYTSDDKDNDTRKHSLSLCPGHENFEENDNPDNWDDATSPMNNGDFGTPGYTNDSCEEVDGDSSDTDIDPITCSTPPPDLEIPDCGHYKQLSEDYSVDTCTVIPADSCHTFWMGSFEGEQYYYDLDEIPQHEVNLTGFAMMRYPVTAEDYKHCIDEGACNPDSEKLCYQQSYPLSTVQANYLIAGMEDHPVNCVSLPEAREFCHWIGGELPTEAQQEYAENGPMRDRYEDYRYFPWGLDDDPCHANIYEGSDPFEESSPIGFFNGKLWTREEGGWLFGPDTYQTCDDSSPFGIHELSHNLGEFLLDGPSDYSTWPELSTDPVMPAKCDGYSQRGTSWNYDILHARCHSRFLDCGLAPIPVIDTYRESVKTNQTGFRCVFAPKFKPPVIEAE